MTLVIGLTGGIGMGKSTAAEHFTRRGVPVFNADACVHRLYDGEAAEPIEAAFPGVTRGGKVDRKLLSEMWRARRRGSNSSKPSCIRWWSRPRSIS